MSETRLKWIDNIISLVTILFFASIYICETYTWGRYILLATSFPVFVLSIVRYRGKFRLSLHPWHMFLLALAAFSLLSALWSISPADSVQKAVTLMEILICFSFMYSYYCVEDNVMRLIRLIQWAGIIVVMYAFFYYGIGFVFRQLFAGRRLENSFTNVNSIGMICATVIIITLYNGKLRLRNRRRNTRPAADGAASEEAGNGTAVVGAEEAVTASASIETEKVPPFLYFPDGASKKARLRLKKIWVFIKKIPYDLVLCVPMFLMMLATQSRKAFVMLVLGLAAVFILDENIRKNWKKILRRSLIALGGMLLLLLLMSELDIFSGIYNRLLDMLAALFGTGAGDESTLDRVKMLRFGWEIFLENPFFGVGFGAPHVLVVQNGIYDQDAYLHNNFIELLAGGGIVAFVLFYAMYAYILVEMYRSRTYANDARLLCFILIAIQVAMGWGYVGCYSKETYFYLMVFFLEARQLRIQRCGAPEVRQWKALI